MCIRSMHDDRLSCVSAVDMQDNGNGTTEPLDPATTFYGDLSQEDQVHWIAQLTLQRADMGSGFGYPGNPGYLDVPVSYLFCENDRAIPLKAQKYMVAQAKSKGAVIQTETCSASHSPFLSQPEVVVKLIQRAAAAL